MEREDRRAAFAPATAVTPKPTVQAGKKNKPQQRSSWMKDFDLRKSPPVWKAARAR